MTPMLLQCGVWVLKDDKCAAQHIERERRFAIDTKLRAVPEYKAMLKKLSTFRSDATPTVFDVGAFIGYWTEMFYADGLWVEAFEPYPDAFECLVKNSEGKSRVRCFNAAVGDGTKVALEPNLMFDSNPGTRQCLRSEAGNETVILDEWVESGKVRPPYLIKIDAEGAEAKVLLGCTKILENFGPLLVIEMFPSMLDRMGNKIGDIYGILEAHDYTWRVYDGHEDTIRWDIIAKPS